LASISAIVISLVLRPAAGFATIAQVA